MEETSLGEVNPRTAACAVGGHKTAGLLSSGEGPDPSPCHSPGTAWAVRNFCNGNPFLNMGLTTGFRKSLLKQRVKCAISVEFVPISKLSCLSI